MVRALSLLMLSSPALAADEVVEPSPTAWRNEQPGWGIGLRYGPQGPGASLRGWSSAALSIDVDGGLQIRSQRPEQGSELWAPTIDTTAWVDIAPRIRLYGSGKTDVLLVPSGAVHLTQSKVGAERAELTKIRGALGVAVDHWVAPGVSVTGRLDALQVGHERWELRDDVSSNQLVAFELSPTVAVHVYPNAKRRRGSGGR